MRTQIHYHNIIERSNTDDKTCGYIQKTKMEEQIIRSNEYLMHIEQYEDDHRVIESIHSSILVSANMKVIVKTTKAE